MEKIQDKTLPRMENELKELLGKFLFISDYMQISPIVSKLQTQAIQWWRSKCNCYFFESSVDLLGTFPTEIFILLLLNKLFLSRDAIRDGRTFGHRGQKCDRLPRIVEGGTRVI